MLSHHLSTHLWADTPRINLRELGTVKKAGVQQLCSWTPA